MQTRSTQNTHTTTLLEYLLCTEANHKNLCQYLRKNSTRKHTHNYFIGAFSETNHKLVLERAWFAHRWEANFEKLLASYTYLDKIHFVGTDNLIITLVTNMFQL